LQTETGSRGLKRLEVTSPTFAPNGRGRGLELSTAHHAPQASALFDKFHVLRHLGDALDQFRKREYARVSGRERRFIKEQSTRCWPTART